MPLSNPPVISALVRDPDVARQEMRVFLALCEHLDVVEFRVVKLLVIARSADMSVSNVSRSITRLIERGYLVRGPRDGARGSWCYRIPYSRVRPMPPLGDEEEGDRATA